jgi:hypothetical protein
MKAQVIDFNHHVNLKNQSAAYSSCRKNGSSCQITSNDFLHFPNPFAAQWQSGRAAAHARLGRPSKLVQ